MLYHYTAYNQQGNILEDEIEAGNIAEVLMILQRRGLKPILVKPKYSKFHLFLKKFLKLKKGKITIKDQAFLCKYLYLMLKVGTDLSQATDILKHDFPKQVVKDFLEEVKTSLQKGRPFWRSFDNHPEYFSKSFVAMIKAGETSGKLEDTFHNLSISLEKKEELRKRIRSALIYPSLLVVTSLVVIGVIVFVAMPRISKIFLSTGIKPPTFTLIVIKVSQFIASYGGWILFFFFLSIIGYYFFYKKTGTGKKFTNSILYRLPVVGHILENIDLQSFCSTFSSLLSSGLPIVEAINISADVVKSNKIREALLRIGKNKLVLGQTLDQAFRSERENFPNVLVSLIGMSEKAGHLEVTLQTLADFYTTEVDSTVKGLMSILEPVLLLFIGGIVAIVALSTIVPIYQMVTKITS